MIYGPSEGLSNSLFFTYLYSYPQLCRELFQDEMNCDKVTQLESGHKSFAFFNSRISIYIYTQGIFPTKLMLNICQYYLFKKKMKYKHLIVKNKDVR